MADLQAHWKGIALAGLAVLLFVLYMMGQNKTTSTTTANTGGAIPATSGTLYIPTTETVNNNNYARSYTTNNSTTNPAIPGSIPVSVRNMSRV